MVRICLKNAGKSTSQIVNTQVNFSQAEANEKGRVGTKRPRRALRVCAAFSESVVLLYSARPASLPPRMAREMLKGLAQSPMA